jgi:hypothetical protein
MYKAIRFRRFLNAVVCANPEIWDRGNNIRLLFARLREKERRFDQEH